MKHSAFQKLVWDYYAKNKRPFPWRETHNPYFILVSEIMLQQTQTDRVVPKYEMWMKLFPNFETLAKAKLTTVLRAWQGLGYNRRALALHRTANEIGKTYKGEFPVEYEKILALPGIGPYTAGAVLAFAFNTPTPIIETNIRTCYIHHFFKREHGQIDDKELLNIIDATLDRKNPREWYYALMDYGAMLKHTLGNANTRSKHYAKQSPFKGSNRERRSLVLKLITEKPRTTTDLVHLSPAPKEVLQKILDALVKEGFLKKMKNTYHISH